MAYELPEVEAPNGAIARGKGCIISFHAAPAELPPLFGMGCTRVFLRHPYAGAKYILSDNRGLSESGWC